MPSEDNSKSPARLRGGAVPAAVRLPDRSWRLAGTVRGQSDPRRLQEVTRGKVLRKCREIVTSWRPWATRTRFWLESVLSQDKPRWRRPWHGRRAHRGANRRARASSSQAPPAGREVRFSSRIRRRSLCSVGSSGMNWGTRMSAYRSPGTRQIDGGTQHFASPGNPAFDRLAAAVGKHDVADGCQSPLLHSR